jgi:cysteinyl-tRNA synthetase
LALLYDVHIPVVQFKSTVTDPSVFRSLAAYWEDQFFKDMRRLKVRDPDTLTRVTEYVREIVSFVERIIDNGYGYVVDGSVYFDTNAFDKAEGHNYAKLEPWSKGNRALLEEGEGQACYGEPEPFSHALLSK